MIIKIGTRKSQLALAQVDIVINELKKVDPTLDFEIIKIVTSGDKFYDKNLAEMGGKGLFLKEIEEALLANEVDMAIHSMKDVPAELPQGLIITSVLERGDPRDVFVSEKYNSLKEMPKGSVLGTSSARRAVLAKEINPLIEVAPFRGNVNTRLDKISRGEVDAAIFAYAGLDRLGLNSKFKEILDPTQFIPAVAQGAIGIETRKNDIKLQDILAKINHEQTFRDVAKEREFLKQHGGNCTAPIGAYVQGDLFHTMSLDEKGNLKKQVL
jgi:hydroxymethylbilane synthase